MDVFDAIKARRSIRFFKQEQIPSETLLELIEAARCAPSAANKQPLEYVIINAKEQTDRVFEQLAWAANVKPKRKPPADKRPVAYIIVLINKKRELAKFGPVDAAAAIENILLAAQSKSIGTCWLGSVNRDNVKDIVNMPDNYEINSVVALGYPAEEPIMEDSNSESTEYYLDDNNILHVPKRSLNAITHINNFGLGI